MFGAIAGELMETNTAFQTEVCPYGKAGVDAAAALIRAGQCVAVPTETVYGLAADATNGEAVARIYAAKGRPSFNPLIVHVPDLTTAETIAVFSDAARDLAARYWPGPLTLVLPLKPHHPIAAIVTAGLPTIALRMPAHPAMQDVIRAAGRPLAAPSANASGTISPTCAAHVARTLDGRIPMILDGGATEIGLESTIVAVEGDQLRLLRPGPIDLALPMARGGGIEAPGQLDSHYAPAKPLRLNATVAKPDEWLIGFGPMACDANLSESSDLVEAAARLFACLHEADMAQKPRIAVAPLPQDGLGEAIHDRLVRAAA
jgi:L-threonylcarbamoyladenylate synthase